MAEAHAKNVARHREELAWIRARTAEGDEPDFRALAFERRACRACRMRIPDIELKLRRTWARRKYWDGAQTDRWYFEHDRRAE